MVVGTGSRARRGPRIAEATAARIHVWTRVTGTTLGIAALTAAGQLGVAYGLGVVRFPRTFPAGGLWATQLTWVAWIAALAVLAGAAAGAWKARRMRGAPGAPTSLELGHRMLVALLAGAGAGLTIGLTALPARAAEIPGANPAPALEAALAASLGVVAGILAAVAALSLRVVAVSIIALVAVVWLVALVAVAPSLAPGAELPLVRLGVLDLPVFGAGARSTIAVLSPPVLALLVGVAVAAAARSRGLPVLHTILSGTAGPALLAVAYLIAAPGADDRSVQAPAFGGALVALAAGLLASVMVAMSRLPAGGAGPLPVGLTGPATREVGSAPVGLAAPLSVPPPAGPDQTLAGGTFAGPAPAGWPDPAPVTPAPVTPAPVTPAPVTPAPVTPAPVTPAPVTPAPVTPAPVTPAAVTAAPEPPVAAEPPWPARPGPAPPSGAAAPKKRGRQRHQRHEDEHVDWVRSLGGSEGEDEDEDTGLGKRRLRLDKGVLEVDDPGTFDLPPGRSRPPAPPG